MQTRPVFPLKVSASGRYLEDQKNRPFFYKADTEWYLTLYMNDADIIAYLNDRRTKGFSAIQVMLTGNHIDVPNPLGDKPFTDSDLSRPVPAFFERVKWFLKQAAARDMLVVGAASWFGNAGQGYYTSLTEANAAHYGAFLGRTFAGHDNLILFLGGDHHPNTTTGETHATKVAINRLGNGIKAKAPRRLLSYHSQSRSSIQFHNEAWLDFNMIQVHTTNSPLFYSNTLDDYNRKPIKTTLMVEAAYEHELRSTPHDLRSAAYWSILYGSFGLAYGNGKVYKIKSVERSPWKRHLDDPGTLQMGYLRDLFAARQWQALEPDQASRLITAGAGAGSSFAAAAVARDRRFALAYVPDHRPLTVNLSAVSGRVRASWYDPTNGAYRLIGSYPPKAGAAVLTPPSSSSSSDTDFVLVLDSEAA